MSLWSVRACFLWTWLRTPLLFSNCRVITPKLLYCSAIVALLRQNSFIAQQLSRYYAKTPLSLTDCRVLAPELLYCSAIVAFQIQNFPILNYSLVSTLKVPVSKFSYNVCCLRNPVNTLYLSLNLIITIVLKDPVPLWQLSCRLSTSRQIMNQDTPIPTFQFKTLQIKTSHRSFCGSFLLSSYIQLS